MLAPVIYTRHQVIRMLDHTADVGFEIETSTLKGLFDEARNGLLEVMFESPPERGEDECTVSLTAPDLETLLVRWINELAYLIQTAEFVPTEANIEIEEDHSLAARLSGAPLDVEAHGFQGEVKSATFHGLSVEQRDGGWHAQIILDV